MDLNLSQMEGSHKPLEEVLQAYVSEYPTDWATQLPLARWTQLLRSRCQGSARIKWLQG